MRGAAARGSAAGHLSSCATQDPSREMAHTPRLQPGSCHVAPPARNPELVWQPDLELDSGDCLSELGSGAGRRCWWWKESAVTWLELGPDTGNFSNW